MAFHIVILREEKFLAKAHGAPYAAYVARVPRFFPDLALYDEGDARAFRPRLLRTTLLDGLVFLVALPAFELIDSRSCRACCRSRSEYPDTCRPGRDDRRDDPGCMADNSPFSGVARRPALTYRTAVPEKPPGRACRGGFICFSGWSARRRGQEAHRAGGTTGNLKDKRSGVPWARRRPPKEDGVAKCPR